MNMLNTICWRYGLYGYGLLYNLCHLCNRPSRRLPMVGLSILLMIIFFTPSAAAQSTRLIDIQANTENEFFIADYQQGDAPNLGVAVSHDSYVYVFSIDSDLEYAQVLPNDFEVDNYVIAAQGARYPNSPEEQSKEQSEGQYVFSLEGMQGFTTLFAIASASELSEARIERYIQKYLLFAEAYNDPTKLASVVIGPDIASDITYLRISGDQVETNSATNSVSLNAASYQPDYVPVDYASATVTDTENDSTQIAQDTESYSIETYIIETYGIEFSTGAYATSEYQEILNSYQASVNVYNTYFNETASGVEPSTTVGTQQREKDSNQNTTFPQTITLTGIQFTEIAEVVEVAVTEVVEAVSSNLTPSTLSFTTSAPAPAAYSTPVYGNTSSNELSNTQTNLIIEQSFQSSINTTSFRNWDALNFENYRFVLQQYCYCTDDYLAQMLVSVEQGQVSRVQYLENNQDVPDYVFASIPSIEELFIGIAAIRVEGVTTVNVMYDKNFSFPNSAYFVHNPETDADDLSYQISYFEVQ